MTLTSKPYIIILTCLLLTLVGCRVEEEEQVKMHLALCLPISENNAASAPRRVMGDPGTTEHLELPRYAYIFVMKQTGQDTWEVWRREELTIRDDEWTTTLYSGQNSTRGDRIYQCTKDIYYLLRNETPQGRVYGICSNKRLTFNTAMSNISTLSDLMNWTFDTSPDSIQDNLQNIYSTPYNYERNDKYYCTFDCMSGHSITVDLLMYHVASKVDINWYVADTSRIKRSDPSQSVRLTYMDALNLYDGPAYCFRPMENVKATLPNTGKTIHIVRPEDEGLWWEGRTYFYTIPYTVGSTPGDYFPLQMLLRTNGSSDNYRPTLNLRVDTSTPFVPWMRANFNLSKPLGDEAVTKTIENN